MLLPNLYFPPPSSPSLPFPLLPSPPVGHPLTILRETQTSREENIPQPLITSHIIAVAMKTHNQIYVTLLIKLSNSE